MNTMVLSWLTHYFKRKEEEIVFTEVKIFFDKLTDLYLHIYDHLLEYSQINELCSDILNQIGYFFERVGAGEFYFILFSKGDLKRCDRLTRWMIDKIYNIIHYYSGLDENERRIELREREDNIRATQTQGFEKKTVILSNILNKESIKRYGENRLIQVGQAFQRIFHNLLSLNDAAYNHLLAEIDFTKHFVEFLKINYHFIVSAIRTQTDTIHIMANYAEESRLRLKIFEKLLKSSSEDL
mmetsp:Transcript_34363/g.31077  ORF Transcript_34363/g.31077 Transcript_34363/m.31077 type:complete len:240 (-) Transcript_34363:556-1275(-)